MLKAGSREFFRVHADHLGYPNQWFLDDPIGINGQEIDPREFTYAKAYMGVRPAALHIGNSGQQLAFNLGAFEMPVVSAAVADVVRQIAINDVELFSVDIPGVQDSYFILNAVRGCPCLDEARSDFTRWLPGEHRPDRVGTYHWISKIRLDTARLEDSHIFRISDWTIALFVSSELKQALAEIPRLGIVFECVT